MQEAPRCNSSSYVPQEKLQEEVFHSEGGDALEQVAQGGCGCPIPGGIQGQVGWGPGQPGLVVGDPAHSRGLKLDDHCGPFHPRSFYDKTLLYLLQFTVTCN